MGARATRPGISTSGFEPPPIVNDEVRSITGSSPVINSRKLVVVRSMGMVVQMGVIKVADWVDSGSNRRELAW